MLSEDAVEILIRRGKSCRLVVHEKSAVDQPKDDKRNVPTTTAEFSFVDRGLKWIQSAVIKQPWSEMINIIQSTRTEEIMQQINKLVSFDRPITILPTYQMDNWATVVIMDTGDQNALFIIDSSVESSINQRMIEAIIKALQQNHPHRKICHKEIRVPPRDTKADGASYLLHDIIRWLLYIMKHPDGTFQDMANHMAHRPTLIPAVKWQKILGDMSAKEIPEIELDAWLKSDSDKNTVSPPTIIIPPGQNFEDDQKILVNGTEAAIPLTHGLLAKLTEEHKALEKNKRIRCNRQVGGYEIRITTAPRYPTRFIFIRRI